MGTQHCFATLNLCAMRVATLTSTGAPSPGANKGYATNEAIKLDVGVETQSTKDLEHKNGCGDLIAAFKEPEKIKRLTLGMDLSILDAELLSLMAGFTLFTSGGQTVGAQFPSTGTSTSGAQAAGAVSLEVWCRAMDQDEQAVPTFTTPNGAFFCFVFPKTTWVLDKFTLENDFSVFPIKGKGEDNSRITANGPYDDWPAAIAGPGGITSMGGFFFDDALPAMQCGRITVPGIAS